MLNALQTDIVDRW